MSIFSEFELQKFIVDVKHVLENDKCRELYVGYLRETYSIQFVQLIQIWSLLRKILETYTSFLEITLELNYLFELVATNLEKSNLKKYTHGVAPKGPICVNFTYRLSNHIIAIKLTATNFFLTCVILHWMPLRCH